MIDHARSSSGPSLLSESLLHSTAPLAMTEEKTVGFSEILTTEYEHNDPALPRIDSPSGSSTGFGRTKKSKGKFQVDVNDVIDFIFPQTLQHPLAAGRLFCYGLYGPLDEDNNMRTGPRGAHKTSVWELDQMCLQVEREDILAIYMKKRCDIGLLSIEEQESLILQADPKLKKAAGKSMLPKINKQDVYGIFAVRLHSLTHCMSILFYLTIVLFLHRNYQQTMKVITVFIKFKLQLRHIGKNGFKITSLCIPKSRVVMPEARRS